MNNSDFYINIFFGPLSIVTGLVCLKIFFNKKKDNIWGAIYEVCNSWRASELNCDLGLLAGGLVWFFFGIGLILEIFFSE